MLSSHPYTLRTGWAAFRPLLSHLRKPCLAAVLTFPASILPHLIKRVITLLLRFGSQSKRQQHAAATTAAVPCGPPQTAATTGRPTAGKQQLNGHCSTTKSYMCLCMAFCSSADGLKQQSTVTVQVRIFGTCWSPRPVSHRHSPCTAQA